MENETLPPIANSNNLSNIQGRCFGCKKDVAITNPKIDKTKNNRVRVHGECAECHQRQVSKFVSGKNYPNLQ